MQSYQKLPRALPAITKRITPPKTTTRTMAFFPRSLAGADSPSSFTPLFRLLDDFDHYNTSVHPERSSKLRSFQPKFDVKELADAYELHGELAGLEQKDVDIEFTDPQTITIRGHVEREYHSGTPPAGAIELSQNGGAITQGGEQQKQPPKPTVEDEDAASKGTSVAVQQQKQESQGKFWVTERSVGEFQRSFSFPTRVDHDAVKASLNKGILSIIVPKAKKHETRKITIS